MNPVKNYSDKDVLKIAAHVLASSPDDYPLEYEVTYSDLMQAALELVSDVLNPSDGGFAAEKTADIVSYVESHLMR